MQQPERRYSIGEVSEMLDVSVRALRLWEDQFKQLRPKRDRVKRRYYLHDDIEVARRIKQLLKGEKLSAEGARIRLAQELHLEGRPRTKKELADLVDSIEDGVHNLLDRMDRNDALLRPPREER
ncbi:MAG: MerR family transcriptional regulator [Candidatus Hydrogenedentes bacterium]|nr:MerR family transcriptional regulator [Candidatus Hydrogenedentota bacterium]